MKGNFNYLKNTNRTSMFHPRAIRRGGRGGGRELIDSQAINWKKSKELFASFYFFTTTFHMHCKNRRQKILIYFIIFFLHNHICCAKIRTSTYSGKLRAACIRHFGLRDAILNALSSLMCLPHLQIYL